MKATTCRQCREWIQQAAFEDLAAAELESMEVHLQDCAECRGERQALESALVELRAYPEASVPRHFYIDAQPRLTLWGLFSQLTPVWRTAAAGLLLAALAMGGAAASRLNVESEDGVLKLAFGEIRRQPEIDPEQLKLELVRQLDAKIDDNREQWFALLREEIDKSADQLTEGRRNELRLAADRLEQRFELRLEQARLKSENDIEAAALQLYKTLSQQQRRQLALLNDRIDLLAVSGRIQGNQTEALMATMLQIADLKGGAN